MNGQNQAVVEEGLRSLQARLDDHAQGLSSLAAATIMKGVITDDDDGGGRIDATTPPEEMESSPFSLKHVRNLLQDRGSLAFAISGAIGFTAAGWFLRSLR